MPCWYSVRPIAVVSNGSDTIAAARCLLANFLEAEQTLVNGIKPSSSRRLVSDETLAGFGVVVQPSGLKSYCFNYRNPEGKCRRVMIGHPRIERHLRPILGKRHAILSPSKMFGRPLPRSVTARRRPTSRRSNAAELASVADLARPEWRSSSSASSSIGPCGKAC